MRLAKPTIVFLYLASCWAMLLAQARSKPYQPIVDSNNRFAVRILQKEFADSQKNLILSPAALSASLSFFLNATSPETRDEIRSALELSNLTIDEINQQNLALMGEHPPRKGKYRSRPSGRNRNGHKMNAAEAWEDRWKNGERPPEGYFRVVGFFSPAGSPDARIMKIGRDYYGIKQLDLKPDWTNADLDAWMKSVLMGTEKLPPRKYNTHFCGHSNDSACSDFKIIDASSFNSLWTDWFETADTEEGPFHISPDKSKNVRMMYRKGAEHYGEDRDYQVVKLPYRESYSMLVVLPREGLDLGDFLRELSPNFVSDVRSLLSSRPGTLKIPKFEIAATWDVTPALKRLGLTGLFRNVEAFAPTFTRGGVLVDVRSRTRFKIDEYGTKIITVTDMSGVIGGVAGWAGKVPPPFVMVVDRPFLFFIQDDTTGEVVYAGAIVDP